MKSQVIGKNYNSFYIDMAMQDVAPHCFLTHKNLKFSYHGHFCKIVIF